MYRALRPLHIRHTADLGLVVLLLLSLALMAGYLAQGFEQQDKRGGWRRIDLKLLTDKIERGELSNHPAAWARPVENAP